MAYHKKAAKIRRQICLYTTSSVIKHLIRFLHKPPRPIADGVSMPWLICLAFEWAIELTPEHYAREATETCVREILQMLWELQNSAVDNDSPNFMLEVRKILISQTRFQQERNKQFIFLCRFSAILSLQNGNKWLSAEFEKQTSLSLDKFLVLSTWLFEQLSMRNNHFVIYEDIITELYPAFTVDDIAKFLKMVGGTLSELKAKILEVRPSSREIRQSEYFEEPALISRPAILFNDGVSTSHLHVLAIGLSEFVMRTLKFADPARFKKTFTKLYETYIENLLKEYRINFSTEQDINNIYAEAGVTSKVVDFLINDGSSSLFIDAKAVEPKRDALTSGYGRFIREKIKDSHIKGVTQIAECSETLNKIEKVIAPVERRYGLIVTHQEFFISDTDTLISYDVDTSVELQAIINGRFLGSNIHFCTVADLELALNVCQATGATLLDIVRYCSVRQTNRATRRFMFEQHVIDFNRENGGGPLYRSNPILESQADHLRSQLAETLVKTADYWGNDAPLKVQNFVFAFFFLLQKLGLASLSDT